MSDDELVPAKYRGQIGRKYRSPHQSGYVRRRPIVMEYVRSLLIDGEWPTTEKIARLIEALDRGHVVNSKTISYDLYHLRKEGKVWRYPNSHRVKVEDSEGPRIYPSLRWAADAEGCSKEAARKWLMKPGQMNRRGQIWSYVESPEDRPKTNQRKKGG
ncbi:hypothetical protein [Aureimonas populi]|uniref:Uncharacterized protein n=1 Tax=Aureimonas populi TaxID=1701758 RepID=A0ABW5CNV9_9HYPH|nr:hypothetical protein [Aureimonas populi]